MSTTASRKCYAEQTHDLKTQCSRDKDSKERADRKNRMRGLRSPTDFLINKGIACFTMSAFQKNLLYDFKSAIPMLLEILFLLNTYWNTFSCHKLPFVKHQLIIATRCIA